MLVHQLSETEGDGVPSVNLNSRTVTRFNAEDICHSGIRLGSDGVLSLIQGNGGFSTVQGEWLNVGDPTTFYVQRTILNGTLEVDPGTGFLQLNTARIYDNQKATIGSKTTEVFFEISSDVSGVPVVASATMEFNSNRETDQ